MLVAKYPPGAVDIYDEAALGILMLGQPVLAYRVNMLFRADLSRSVYDREINICFIAVHGKDGA